jgi:ferric-dicitrate binding protein FerR (iron transport regulator)
MQGKENITDEMIARYLSGKATPEEEAVVLDYLAESDENLDDFLAMSAAIELNSKESKENAPAELSTFNFQLSTQRKRPLWPALSAAASVALLIGVGIAIWHNSGDNVGIDPAPAYAEQDSIVVTNMEDTL